MKIISLTLYFEFIVIKYLKIMKLISWHHSFIIGTNIVVWAAVKQLSKDNSH
jgi:hypothetical protein